ncbi:FxsB family cyclophane-forming radical SAM/SPASM peptide maturase [Streptomyces sp. SID13726]|uniref:FxsB family cyclophane-forming radical SAM/SPASM peptide maturase n=1 Tax=Streptomyces sp. SID13726 TaxID=2706058 RepID=UPI0031BB3617
MTGPFVPLRQVVLKVHSRCDLACRHCYVYEHADQSWSSRPKVISEEVVSQVALRLAEHARNHELASVQVILHGGEPLLAGPTRLRHICRTLRTALDGVSALDLRIHTNGVQLSESYLDLFAEFDVRVGVSLDGDQAANDRYRLFASGRSSHDKVLKAIDLLNQARYRHLFAGILCTVDVRNDPIAVLDALVATQAPRVDFLLPHATWDTPPPRPDGAVTPYADWLLAVHDRWTDRGQPMPVRLFDSVVSTLGGGPGLTESMGVESADVVVIETDGTYEQADSLKTAFDGAPVTGMDVFRHGLDDVARHPGMTARQHGVDGLSEQCRSCPVVRSCGGGLFAHRYRGDGTGFDNPSVFCMDLERLVRGLDARTSAGADRPIDGFDALAEGVHDERALRTLSRARRAVMRELLSDLNEEQGSLDGELWGPAWQLAIELGRADGAPLEDLLSHPYVRTWAVRCFDGRALTGDLASHVAAAALPAGLADRVRVPVCDGFVHLPGLGRLRVREGFTSLDLTYPQVSGSAPGWEPLRRVRAEGMDVVLDDVDPHRDCFGGPVSGRLRDEEVEQWRHLLPQSWALIRKALPETASAMAKGVRFVTPLAGPVDSELVQHGGGFAALGLPLDSDPVRMAVDLVRGFRLGLLDVLLDVCDLYDEADVRTGRLLADTYARVATDALRCEPGAAHRTRGQWEELTSAASLTALGRRFVDGIGRGL